MQYRFIFTNWFDRNLKSLAKHNSALRGDIETFLRTFEAEDHPVISGTGGARKARMKAKGQGKRGGYRVVYYFLANENNVWLITVYDKVRQEDLSPAEQKRIRELVRVIKQHL